MSHLTARLQRYVVTDSRAGSVEQLVDTCRCILGHGITTIQLRAKGWTDRQLLDTAISISVACRNHGALFIVNDRVDIAQMSGADGVHLGVDDVPVGLARQLLGPDAIIGYSPESDDDRVLAEAAGVSYFGVGPVFSTGTKADAGEAIGLAGIRRVVAETSIPVVGIGGITIETAADVVAAGAVGVAVVGAVFLADNPATAADRLREVLR